MKLTRKGKSIVFDHSFHHGVVFAECGDGGGQTAQLASSQGIDAYVARAIKVFAVPGIALAVVKDGRVVLTRGFGVKKLGGAEKIDAQTLFVIASNTKLFTAVALGQLVEEGRLAWDAPVIDYMPGFCMWDPFVTRELSVRDLLVHRGETTGGRRPPMVAANNLHAQGDRQAAALHQTRYLLPQRLRV